MKTTIALLIALLLVSTVAIANEADKPENCLATRATDSRKAGKDVEEDKEKEEKEITVQSA